MCHRLEYINAERYLPQWISLILHINGLDLARIFGEKVPFAIKDDIYDNLKTLNNDMQAHIVQEAITAICSVLSTVCARTFVCGCSVGYGVGCILQCCYPSSVSEYVKHHIIQ